jgi:hypothetical protein
MSPFLGTFTSQFIDQLFSMGLIHWQPITPGAKSGVESPGPWRRAVCFGHT